MQDSASTIFEAALRGAGLQRMRLDQVVTAYHKAFPEHAMRPDMRQCLHDAIIELVQAGVVSVPEGDGVIGDDPLSLPHAVEMIAAVNGPEVC